ncbi:thyroid receptor-interacting protein 11-like [Harmonia axyridis]|uniref:thyroid receptor-interacting protein 11-like n=1 Tax=Harmonia axyridis TaxID=115357 RepID=UPI001E278993|nr:thyroid receptor-interacting protein 11-like [Harmonia axyridis]
MSWLNFNDSLNSLKGQISNFANNVLAEDVLECRDEVDSKESEIGSQNEVHGNAYNTEDAWSWSAVESKTDQLKTDETITNLKKKIDELQNENRDLLTSLDQLDQNHQQNTEELVKMKNKLSEELENVTEKYEMLNMKYNKLALAENAYKKKITELKNKCDGFSQRKNSDDIKNDNNDVTQKYKNLEIENLQLKERIATLEAASSKNSGELTNSDAKLTSLIEELQMENKALKIALQTTNELKATQNNEKLIKEYENEIANLRNELKALATVESPKKEDNTDLEKDIIDLQTKLDTINTQTEKEKSKLVEQLNEYEMRIAGLELELNEVKKNRSDVEAKYCELQEIKQELEKTEVVRGEELKQHYHKKCSDLEAEYAAKIQEIELQNNKNTDVEKEVTQRLIHALSEDFKDYINDPSLLPNDFKSFTEFLSNQTKSKIEALATKSQELNQIRIELQNEKDEEIEKLSRDSERLKKELSNKLKDLEDMEEECSQLMKNNELLISKLDEYKKTGLQTIFESNEDNVAILEKQLEVASRRNEELEQLISENKHFTREENDHQISKEDIAQNLEKLEEEKNVILTENEELKNQLKIAESERDNCRLLIDKMRLDFETTEYQFSEMNINLETLSEEIEKHKMRIDHLVSENESLKSLRQYDSKNDEELKMMREEIFSLKEANRVLQKEIEETEDKWQRESRDLERNVEELRTKLEKTSIEKSNLQKSVDQSSTNLACLEEAIETYKSENGISRNVFHALSDILGLKKEELETSEICEHVKNMKDRLENLQGENMNLISELESFKTKTTENDNEEAQKELQTLIASRNELIAIVQTKHQETLTYHAEIQRLSEILKKETEKSMQMENEISTLKLNTCPAASLKAKEEEIEKLNDQIAFLREKCDVVAQSMLEEQQKLETEKLASSEKEATLAKKLERLQSHLMEVEEHYTQELLQSEQNIALLQARLNEVEKREKDSSNVYTSVSIRANQQNEALTQQLQSLTNQRDEFRKKLLDLEDENNVKSAALTNLQLVLEQFQRDKDADVMRETDRIRRQVKHEQTIQEDLRKEIANLENQMKESKQGLQAALRLTDQLEMSKVQITTLREEVSVLNEKLQNKEAELKMVTSQTDGKVDKSLIKNLIIGFVTSNKNLNKDQKQILKIIATVLDFNEQDHNKVNLNQAQQNTWLNSLLSPMSDDLPPNESLSRAFVNFLENESKPRVIPSLLPQSPPSENSSVNNSTRTTPTPIVLNEIVLPTFSDFPQHRNSSSILKGVLKDNP